MPNRDLSPAAVMRPARTIMSASARDGSASDRWMVTGTTRSSGQASIMATSTPARQLGEELGVAGMPEARILQGLLLDRDW